MRLGHGDHGDSDDYRDNHEDIDDNGDKVTVTLLVEQFHCRSDPRLKEMLAKFNIYVENVGGGSVSLKKTIRCLLIACFFLTPKQSSGCEW